MLKKKKEGFTLIEMLVVVSIIILLIAFIVTVVVGVLKRASIRKTEALINRLGVALKTYYAEYRNFPPTDSNGDANQSLTYVMRHELPIYDPETGDLKKTLDPLIEFKSEELSSATPPRSLDAWGNPLNYYIDSVTGYGRNWKSLNGEWKTNERFADVWSNGPDGTDDSGDFDADCNDDITNWKTND